jgi:BirA family biotin operon repressor/biotin-[acetyl-CoA-carboxylase] ligase
MAKMESTRSRLIAILSEHHEKYISGQEISKALDISRNSVWKHMKALEKDGYEIEGVPRKGYRIMKHPDKVSDNTIKWGLHTNWLGQAIIHKQSVPSTQLLIHEAAREGADHGTVAIADEQTKGRGRLNRTWYSAGNKGMWLSMLLRPEILPQQAPQLTLLTATVLADVIKAHTTLNPRIKWPNDILLNNKKAAGILTEMQAEQDQIQYIVIGIGFNMNQHKEDLSEDIESTATSLHIETGREWPLTAFIQQFLEAFEIAYERFIQNGFREVKTKWESYGFKIGEKIKITNQQQEREAIFFGIADDGALQIKDEANKVSKIYSGEISWFN